MCSTPWFGVVADEFQVDALARIAERARRPGDAVGMRAEGDRARLRRAPAVGGLGVRKKPVHLLEELSRRRRRAGDGDGDGAEVGLGEFLGLAHHQRQHGRHRGDHVDRMAIDGADVAPCREAGHQHDGAAVQHHQLGAEQAVHVEQRRGDDRLLALDAGPLLGRGAGRPDIAAVRQRHALGQAGRARGVEHHRDFLGPHVEGSKGPGSSRCRDRSMATRRHQRGDQRRALGVGDGELDAESFMMCATVSRGSLWLTQTETRPAAMVAM